MIPTDNLPLQGLDKKTAKHNKIVLSSKLTKKGLDFASNFSFWKRFLVKKHDEEPGMLPQDHLGQRNTQNRELQSFYIPERQRGPTHKRSTSFAPVSQTRPIHFQMPNNTQTNFLQGQVYTTATQKPGHKRAVTTYGAPVKPISGSLLFPNQQVATQNHNFSYRESKLSVTQQINTAKTQKNTTKNSHKATFISSILRNAAPSHQLTTLSRPPSSSYKELTFAKKSTLPKATPSTMLKQPPDNLKKLRMPVKPPGHSYQMNEREIMKIALKYQSLGGKIGRPPLFKGIKVPESMAHANFRKLSKDNGIQADLMGREGSEVNDGRYHGLFKGSFNELTDLAKDINENPSGIVISKKNRRKNYSEQFTSNKIEHLVNNLHRAPNSNQQDTSDKYTAQMSSNTKTAEVPKLNLNLQEPIIISRFNSNEESKHNLGRNRIKSEKQSMQNPLPMSPNKEQLIDSSSKKAQGIFEKKKSSSKKSHFRLSNGSEHRPPHAGHRKGAYSMPQSHMMDLAKNINLNLPVDLYQINNKISMTPDVSHPTSPVRGTQPGHKINFRINEDSIEEQSSGDSNKDIPSSRKPIPQRKLISMHMHPSMSSHSNEQSGSYKVNQKTPKGNKNDAANTPNYQNDSYMNINIGLPSNPISSLCSFEKNVLVSEQSQNQSRLPPSNEVTARQQPFSQKPSPRNDLRNSSYVGAKSNPQSSNNPSYQSPNPYTPDPHQYADERIEEEYEAENEERSYASRIEHSGHSAHSPAQSNTNYSILRDVEIQRKVLIEKIRDYSLRTRKIPDTNLEFYTLSRLLGEGSYGKVYLGCSVLCGQPVAIKCYDRSKIRGKTTSNRIIQEIEIIKSLSHDNIIKMLEIFENKRFIFMVIEYADNGDFLSYMKRHGRFRESAFIPLLVQILEALGYLHGRKILHRDIKLDNILLTKDGKIKICDFGVSRKMPSKGLLFEHIGTPAYLAPEIIAEKGYSGYKADIWSLGITCYIALTGQVPFKGEKLEELQDNIMNKTLEFPKECGLSEPMRRAIAGMLEKNPRKRFYIDEIAHTLNLDINIDSELKQKTLDRQKIEQIRAFGFDERAVISSISGELINHSTALYKLL
jgi:serine/threonine protein kinase